MSADHKYNRVPAAGSGLWIREESAVQHQDAEADPGGVAVSAEDVWRAALPSTDPSVQNLKKVCNGLWPIFNSSHSQTCYVSKVGPW